MSFLLKINFAPCLSKRVFPRKVPKPSPDLSLIFFDLDLIYGSPTTPIMSSGNPGPSSLILIRISLLLLITSTSTLFCENLTALPIKFLSPEIIYGLRNLTALPIKFLKP